MRILKPVTIGLALSLSYASWASAGQAPLCSRALDRDDYEWLERDTSAKNEWVQSQTGRMNAILKTSQNRMAFEKFLTNYFSTPNTMDIAEGKDPGGVPFTVKIMDRGLGRGKSVDVEVEKNGQKKTVLSSYDFKRNNSVIPVDLSLSPDGRSLLVKTSTHGSLDAFTGILIDLDSGARRAKLENMDSGDPVWVSKVEIHYDENGLNAPERSVRIENGQATLGLRSETTPHFRGSQDHQWAFATTRPAGQGKASLLLQSTTTGQTVSLPVVSVKEIFYSTENELWLQTRGREGFGEILRVKLSKSNAGLKASEITAVVPEINRVIDSATVLKDHVIVNTFLGGDRSVEIIDLNGRSVGRIQAPDCCQIAVSDFDAASGKATLTLNSPARRKVKWSYDLKTKKWSVNDKDVLRPADPDIEMMSDGGVEFVTSYSSYKSKDGTEIPVRVTHRKDAVLDHNAPTLLEGYGGFGLNNYFHPEFNPMRLEFLRAGGVHVAPALRGSTFFGQAWHDDGRALNKQNVVDDFIAAAEWIITRGISTPKKIAISGASHGGLLVGAALTQRPDLFGLAFPQFGPHDFSRKPFLDPVTTPHQVSEYGDLYKDPAAIALAQTISPYLRAVPGIYPMTVVITGQQDSRVNPEHSFRYAAHLMDSQRGSAPIFLYSLKNSGHWMMSEDRQDLIAWRANTTYWAVLFDFFGLKLNSETLKGEKK